MLIGKLHFLLLLSFVCIGCASAKNEILIPDPEEAWWVSEEFVPHEENIKGIPIEQIMSGWKHVAVLNKDYLEKRLSESQFRDIRQSQLRFKVRANLDNKPNSETFIVGVYETFSGQKGRFIAIFRDSEFVKLFTHPGFCGYSSIYLEGNQLRWYKCMECADFDLISWSGSDYILQ